MFFKQFLREQTGCASYLIGDTAEGVAAVIDPHWFIEDYIEAARAKGLKIIYTLETHVHADHLSGNRKLAALTGSRIGIHRSAEATYADLQLEHGQEIRLGSVILKIIHSPGHTPESIVIAVSDTLRSDSPWLALTGDTLFIDDVGRPDLAGPGGAAELFDTLQTKLLKLDSAVEVYPAHVAGSPCGRAMNLKTSSTIGYERRNNRALKTISFGKDIFVRDLTADLPLHSPSFETIIAANRQGPPAVDQPVYNFTASEVANFLADGGVLLDVRDGKKFEEGHIPGSLSIPLSIGQLAGRAPWLIEPGQDIVLVGKDREEALEAAREMGAVRPLGRILILEGGFEEWVAGGGLPARANKINVQQLADLLEDRKIDQVLDVRESDEWQSGHILGASNLSYRELSLRWAEIAKEQNIAVICAGGVRSSIAASILENRGFKNVFNVLGGMGSWTAAKLPSVVENLPTITFNPEQVSSATLDWVI